LTEQGKIQRRNLECSLLFHPGDALGVLEIVRGPKLVVAPQVSISSAAETLPHVRGSFFTGVGAKQGHSHPCASYRTSTDSTRMDHVAYPEQAGSEELDRNAPLIPWSNLVAPNPTVAPWYFF